MRIEKCYADKYISTYNDCFTIDEFLSRMYLSVDMCIYLNNLLSEAGAKLKLRVVNEWGE